MKRVTEERNVASRDIDTRTTEDILAIINDEDSSLPSAVREAIPAIARAVDATVARLTKKGRVFYVGAGTSGRLGVLDASEIPPTFGVGADLFQGVIAGGYAACYSATEASEDDPTQGARDLEARGCTPDDVVVGIAASGTTAYTLGAVAWARKLGTLTIALCCNPDAPLSRAAEHAITLVTGAEVIAGSTRMKAGTAQKLVLNMFSTAVMVRLGHVYSNWMINVQMKNLKLRERGLRILQEATGHTEGECLVAMEAAGNDLRVALVMLLAATDAPQARRALKQGGGNPRLALQSLRTSQ